MENQLKNLNLTEKDFQLIIDGLEELPNKGATGQMMMGLMTTVFSDEQNKEIFKKKHMESQQKYEEEKRIISEETKILQGKLLIMKRYMRENNLLAESAEIMQSGLSPAR